MKKLVSLCLLFALVCSLCVTGASAAALSPAELCEKYAPILDALEAGDYDAAIDEIEGSKPPVEYEEVVITEENFYDYFEIVTDDPIESSYTDGTKGIRPGYLKVSVKEGVMERLDLANCSLTIGVKAKKELRRAKIDFENVTVTLGDKMDSKTRKEMRKSAPWFETKVDTQIDLFRTDGMSHYFTSVIESDFFMFKEKTSWGGYWTNGLAEAGSKVKYYQVVYTDIEVLNVSGTLSIAK